LRAGAEVIWVAAGQLVAFVGAFAALKIFTGQLGPEQYGQLSLGMSVAGLVHMFIYGPIEQAALRFMSVYRERGELGLLLAILKKIHFWAAIVVVVGAIGAAVLAQIAVSRTWGLIVLLGALFGLVNGINATASSLRSTLRQQVSVTWFQAFDVWSRLLLACAALLYLNTTANAVLLGFCIATAAIAVVQLALVARNPVVRPHLGVPPRPQLKGEGLSELV
jgi:O-antigen/teichoic acid export membrane protein